ncbi:unnamed protein product [Diplocarpon coronariae]
MAQPAIDARPLNMVQAKTALVLVVYHYHSIAIPSKGDFFPGHGVDNTDVDSADRADSGKRNPPSGTYHLTQQRGKALHRSWKAASSI